MFFEAAIQSMSKKSKILAYEVSKQKLEVSKQNFVFKATKVWNKLIGHALERNEPANSGIIIPGSARNSAMDPPGGDGGDHPVWRSQRGLRRVSDWVMTG